MTRVPALAAEVVDLPGLREETDALLAAFTADRGADVDPEPDPDPYAELLRDRLELPDPLLAGTVDPDTRPRDLEVPLPGRVLEARVYRPLTDAPRPVVLWLHGGGFVGGDLRDIEHAASGIARHGGVVVVSLNYRLAPENPYPAALDDTVDTLAWLRANAGLVHGDGRLVVGGQSAGGALAAGACLVGRDRALPMPDAQVLCYPALDVDQQTESARLFDGVFLRLGRTWSRSAYLPAGDPPAPAVPLRSWRLAGLPPALVVAAGRDPLRDDARAYAERLVADGGRARLVEYADTMHAFLNFPAALTAGRHAIRLVGEHLAAELP